MRCPLCLGRFFLRPLPCGHFLCSYCILSARFRPCSPTDARGAVQCVHCYQKVFFRHGSSPRMAFGQYGGKLCGIKGMDCSSAISPSNPPLFYSSCTTFSRPAGKTVKNNNATGEHCHGTAAAAALGRMCTLRRSRIFPTMEKRTNGRAVKHLGQEWEGTGHSTTTPTEEHRRRWAARKECLFSMPTAEPLLIKTHSSLRQNKLNGEKDRGEYGKGKAYFGALIDRFDSALILINAYQRRSAADEKMDGAVAGRKSVELLLMSAKKHLVKNEQQIWRDRAQQSKVRSSAAAVARRFGHEENNGQSAGREFGIIRSMRELVVAMEEYNRHEGTKLGRQSANFLRPKAGQARLQMLALSVLFTNFDGDNERNLALLKRRISLLGMRMNGKASEQKAEDLLDTLMSCSGQISTVLERRVSSIPPHLISATAHVQCTLFNLMDELTHQLLQVQIEKRTKVWQLINRCFGQLLQMGNLSWRSNEFPWKRFTLIAHLANFLHRFADVCTSPTQMMCIIEVEKARAFVAEESAMSAELRRTLCEQLERIEFDLAECQRVQKWNDLKLGTQIVRRTDGTEVGKRHGDRRRKAKMMREWVQRVISGGRKISQKMMGRGRKNR